MTMLDDTQSPARPRPFLGQVLFYFGASIAAGAIGAGFMLFNRGGLGGTAIGVTLALFVIGGLMLFAGMRVGDFDRPSLSSKTGRAQLLLLGYVILGAVGGIYVNAVHTDDILNGTFQLSAIEAIISLVILLGVFPASALYQWRQFDDFQKAAMKDASFWTFNIYIYGYMAWAIGEAGQIFPPVDHAIIFIAVTFTFLFVWAFKRSG